MDFDWYCRISLCHPKTFKISQPNSFFRLFGNTKTLKNAKEMKEESLLVAQKYLVYLSPEQLTDWYNHKLLERVLRRIYAKKLKNKAIVYLRVIRRIGTLSLLDKRFLGLLKSSLKK
jgi:hypothetical protein